MARVSVGLVLRSTSVEVFEVRQGLVGGVRLEKLISMPIPPHGSGGESINTAVVEAIRAAIDGADVKGAHLGVSVPSQDVLVRSFTMPVLPQEEWRTAVQFEARKYIPFKTEELVWDFHAVEDPATKQLRVLFVGIRSQRLSEIQEWLSAADVKPAFIEAQSVSLARLATQETPSGTSQQREFVGVVDVESDTAHLVIVKDGAPYFARDIHLKPSAGVGAPETAGGLSGGGAPSDSRAETLLRELHVSLEFFTHEHGGVAPMHQLIIFGEEATIAPWCAELAGQLPCPVVMGALPIKERRGQPVDLQLACVVGLALRDFRVSKVQLDFLQASVARAMPKARLLTPSQRLLKAESKLIRKLLRSAVRPAVMQALTALLALTVFAAIGDQRVASAKSDVAKQIRSFPDAGWGLERFSLPTLQAIQSRAESYLAFLRTNVETRTFVTEKLSALAKLLPEGVWVEGLTYQAKVGPTGDGQPTLTLHGACFLPGSADELDVISDFVQRMKQDAALFQGFETVQLGEITIAEEPTQHYAYRAFQLSCSSERRSL